jgi:hypothetical protein
MSDTFCSTALSILTGVTEYKKPEKVPLGLKVKWEKAQPSFLGCLSWIRSEPR